MDISETVLAVPLLDPTCYAQDFLKVKDWQLLPKTCNALTYHEVYHLYLHISCGLQCDYLRYTSSLEILRPVNYPSKHTAFLINVTNLPVMVAKKQKSNRLIIGLDYGTTYTGELITTTLHYHTAKRQRRLFL